jgi:hypothetical protein
VVSTGNIIVRQKGNKVGGRNGECQVWPIYTLPDGFGAALRCAALRWDLVFFTCSGWRPAGKGTELSVASNGT